MGIASSLSRTSAAADNLILGLRRLTVLRLFQVPSLIFLPLTYFVLFGRGGSSFLWTYGLCGFLTIAQFSYLGEFLPKVFPLHLRGTGGSIVALAMAIISLIAGLFLREPVEETPAAPAREPQVAGAAA